jgi:hypothetical protein
MNIPPAHLPLDHINNFQIHISPFDSLIISTDNAEKIQIGRKSNALAIGSCKQFSNTMTFVCVYKYIHYDTIIEHK